MKRYGLTYREQCLSRKTMDYIPTAKLDYSKNPHLEEDCAIGVTALIVITVLVLLTSSFGGESKTHAETKELTDREQEAMYCKAWMNGSEVSGGTESEITKHCKKYL